MRRSCVDRFLKFVFICCICGIGFNASADEPEDESTVMKISLDDDTPDESDGSNTGNLGSSAHGTSVASNSASGANPNSALNKAMLDEKRSRLREQLKRDRADSKRARSIRRNSELNRDGLDEEELELKKKLDYARSHEESEQKQQATDSAKKFSQWVNQNMMINKDKKKKKGDANGADNTVEEAKTSEDLLN